MTVKINMKDRYSFGWSDPRMNTSEINMNLRRKTGLEDVPTEVLRNLWLVKFGGRVVTLDDMHNHRFDDIADVGQELAYRNEIRREEHYRADLMQKLNYYVLEKEDADN